MESSRSDQLKGRQRLGAGDEKPPSNVSGNRRR